MWTVIRFVFAVFFFFKQKTAYEMRISDWSSDVCSSDLHAVLGDRRGLHGQRSAGRIGCRGRRGRRPAESDARVRAGRGDQELRSRRRIDLRSEEHTSELQSLMRISYAVFCLKKKNINYYENASYRLHIRHRTTQV